MHMKKVLFILFLFLVFAGSANAQFSFGNIEITLTLKDGDRDPNEPVGDISPEDAPQTRSVISQLVYASLHNKVVTVDFRAAFPAVTVNVINDTTGETVYSELFINPASFSIDLSGKGTGDYMIEITSDEITLEGHLSL